MKALLVFFFSFLSLTLINGQDIVGSWHGVLDVGAMKLRLVFNISENDGTLSATMDSPDQGASGIPISEISFNEGVLKIGIPTAGISYEGKLIEGMIDGTFKQSGQSFELDMGKKEVKIEPLKRPQNPEKPYPYIEEEVKFDNYMENHTLAGTLTYPSEGDDFPAIILISGSGPQNRNEELLGHKPFLVLADQLTRNGYAVLRYDDRGTAESTGDFKTATSNDFAIDAESAVKYLMTRKNIDHSKIGLMGHSEGGLIAPIVAVNNDNVSFIVLLAGTGLRGDKILLLQSELISRANGTSEEDIASQQIISKKVFDRINKGGDLEQTKIELKEFLIEEVKKDSSDVPEGVTSEQFIDQQIDQVTGPWFNNFLKYDPYPTLQKVKCPVLAIVGEKDLQVPPKENIEMIEKALKEGKNSSFVVKELPNLNHLFQECETGAPNEYSKIEQTFSPTALVVIIDWLKSTVAAN